VIRVCELDSSGSGTCGHRNYTSGYVEGQEKSGLSKQEKL
jgi:hypothetical protein